MSTSPRPKVIVLCFDGTADQFSAKNTNVVKFYGLLDRTSPLEQVTYYQPGIGTYNPNAVRLKSFSKLLDRAVAWYLDEHVMEGYKYLMEHYQPEDKICMFGFSRGAYTARALAGFLFKIGLLPQDNLEQIPLAYTHYKGSDDALAAKFKEAFCTSVTVDFLGVWDTVASVGLIYGCSLPFTSANSAVRVFRHALSLDEHRARFQPNTYHRITPQDARRYKALGLEDPFESVPSVLEVWFAGCHADVGGGAVLDTVRSSLADVTLRWMVEEAIRSGCGIKFSDAALMRAGVDVPSTQTTPKTTLGVGTASPSSPREGGATQRRGNHVEGAKQAEQWEQDVMAGVNDQLKLNPAWWPLEFLPMKFTWQEFDGTWKWMSKWGINFGRGREIRDPSPIFHTSVRQKRENSGYEPRAKWVGKERYTDEL